MSDDKKQIIEVTEQALRELNGRIEAKEAAAKNVRLFVEGYG